MNKTVASKIESTRKMVGNAIKELDKALFNATQLLDDVEKGKVKLNPAEIKELDAFATVIGQIRKAAIRADSRVQPKRHGFDMGGVKRRDPYKHELFFLKK